MSQITIMTHDDSTHVSEWQQSPTAESTTTMPQQQMSDADLLRAAQQRIAELCTRYRITLPSVSLDLRGRCAGQAHGGDHRHHIKLNAVLFRDNFAEFLAQTIPHELCHLWHHQLGLTGRPHGREWQALMQKMNVPPRRCHRYDTTRARIRTVSRYTYHCACQTHAVSAVLHHRMQRGQTYRCRKCRSPLTPPPPG